MVQGDRDCSIVAVIKVQGDRETCPKSHTQRLGFAHRYASAPYTEEKWHGILEKKKKAAYGKASLKRWNKVYFRKREWCSFHTQSISKGTYLEMIMQPSQRKDKSSPMY